MDMCLCCSLICWKWDKGRSYLYIRENSIESNTVMKPCCCLPPIDLPTVTYFDRQPFKTSCKDKCLVCGTGKAKAQIFEPGCLVCCLKMQCCCEKQSAVVVPYESCCFCIPNKITCCCNCCGCCGKPSGNPIYFLSFSPQPKDPAFFVQHLQQRLYAQPNGQLIHAYHHRQQPVPPVQQAMFQQQVPTVMQQVPTVMQQQATYQPHFQQQQVMEQQPHFQQQQRVVDRKLYPEAVEMMSASGWAPAPLL